MQYSILKTIPIFSELHEEELAKISELLYSKSFKRNNIIVLEEEFGDTLFILQSGSVKITRVSDEGREVILAILSEGDFFGEMSIFDGESRSANVIALEDSEVLMLKRSDFLDMLEKFPKIAIALLGELASRLRKSDQQIEGLSLSDAENRIAMTLLRLAEDMGTIQLGQVVIPNLPYQQNIANMAGTSRETVSRMLKLLERKGFIEKKGRQLIILKYEEFLEQFSQ
jgi:CRP-like cAMP-binding protein